MLIFDMKWVSLSPRLFIVTYALSGAEKNLADNTINFGFRSSVDVIFTLLIRATKGFYCILIIQKKTLTAAVFLRIGLTLDCRLSTMEAVFPRF